MIRTHVLICGGTGCTSSNSLKIQEAMNAELVAHGLEDEVKVVLTGCFGLCALGPVMIVYPEGTFYSCVKPEDAKEILPFFVISLNAPGVVTEPGNFYAYTDNHFAR